MTDAAHESPEVEMQILTAQDGTAYLLPRALVEAGRLTPEEAAAFHEAAGDDVQGLMFVMAPALSASLASVSAGSAQSSMPGTQQRALIDHFNAIQNAIQQQMGIAPGMPSYSLAPAPRINSI